MKAQLGAVLLLATSALVVTTAEAPAALAASYSAAKSQAQPIIGERITIRGTLKPAGRPIALEVYRDGGWHRIASKETGSGGSWAFAVQATTVRHAYRTTVPATRVGGTRYDGGTSNVVRVRGIAPTLRLTTVRAPVGQNRAGTANLVPAQARFSPARPGSPVTIQQYDGGTWHSIIRGGHQSATGGFRFNTRGGSSAHPVTLRALSTPGNGVHQVASDPTTPRFLPRVFDDNFSNPVYSRHHWKTRAQAPSGLRQCSRPDKSMISYANGKAVLRVKRVLPPDHGCPSGHFWNAMVGTANAYHAFRATRGIFAARVRFESGQGQHGAFWVQGPAPAGDEIDTIEYYGDGRRDGGLSNLVHHTSRYGRTTSSGGIQRVTKKILGAGRTPANGYHVYSVQWDRGGYTFRMDGFPTYFTTQPHIAHTAEGMILSLVTSDWELKRWTPDSTPMRVDWVRAWSSGS